MPDFVSHMGRVLIFSLIFPGVIGYSAIVALSCDFSLQHDSLIGSRQELGEFDLAFLVVLLGYSANAIGYMLDIVSSVKKKQWLEFIFSYGPTERSCDYRSFRDDQKEAKGAFSYLQDEHNLYFNSGVALVLVLIFTSCYSSKLSVIVVALVIVAASAIVAVVIVLSKEIVLATAVIVMSITILIMVTVTVPVETRVKVVVVYVMIELIAFLSFCLVLYTRVEMKNLCNESKEDKRIAA